MSFTTAEIERLKAEHNEVVGEIQAVEQGEYEGLGESERDELRNRLTAKYERVDEIKAELAKLDLQAQVEASPLTQDAVPAAMTKEGEERLERDAKIARDPFAYWEEHNLPSAETLGGSGDVTFKLEGAADLMFGQPDRRLIPDGDGSFQFASPITSVETQVGTPGLGIFGPPIDDQGMLIDFISQVESPNRAAKINFLRGSITTNGVNGVQEGAALPESILNFATVDIDMEQVGTYAGITRKALRTNAGAMQIVGDVLSRLGRRGMSNKLVVGTGTNEPSGLSTYAFDGHSVATGATNAVGYLTAIGAAIDNVRYAHGGMATDAFLRYEVVTLIRNNAVSNRWLIDRYPEDNGMLRFNGVRLRASGELPAFAATSRVGYVGDFTPANVMFVRQGDLTVEITNAHASDFLTGDTKIRLFFDGNLVVIIPDYLNRLDRSS